MEQELSTLRIIYLEEQVLAMACRVEGKDWLLERGENN